jgi:hypothetical protein
MLKPVFDNLKNILFLTTVCIAIEFVEFSVLGLTYPYPDDIGWWSIRNFALSAFLYWFWFRKKRTEEQLNASETTPKLSGLISRMNNPFSLKSEMGNPVWIGVILTLTIHLAYPYRMFCGRNCYDMGAVILIPGMALIFTGVNILVLWFCLQLNRKEINRWLIAGLCLTAFLTLKPLQLAYLEKKYPVQWWLSTPHDAGSLKSAGELAEKTPEAEWVSLCRRFGFLSFNHHLFGGLHSAKCYFYGATFYKNKSLCEKLPPENRHGSYLTKPPDLPTQKDCFGPYWGREIFPNTKVFPK